MASKKIAIIGGGAAGIAAHWLLSKQYETSLYEMAPILGGHACTQYVTEGNHIYGVDMGVELITEISCPNLFLLLKNLKCETFVAPLSFAASFKGENEYWHNMGNCKGALWQRIKSECDRFHLDMHAIRNAPIDTYEHKTIGEFLSDHQYSEEFIFKALLPFYTTFVATKASLLEYALSYAAFTFNFGMLSFFLPTYWRKVKNGIYAYIAKLTAPLADTIKLNCPVTRIARTSDQILVTDQNHCTEIFDEIILAIPASQILQILDVTHEEKEIFKNFEYDPIECVLHHDANILSPHFKLRPYCEYNDFSNQFNTNLQGSLTRNVRIVEDLPGRKNIFLTANPNELISDKNILALKKWQHPKLRPKDMKIKKLLGQLQGKHHTWFCGTDTTHTGHEGALVSGMVIAEALGAPYPFSAVPDAYKQFQYVKTIMGMPEKIARPVNV